MASQTITLLYNIGDTVFYVNFDTGIRKGVVQSIDVTETLPNNNTKVVKYTIQFTHPQFGNVVAAEETLFPDVDTAFTTLVTGYRALVLTQ